METMDAPAERTTSASTTSSRAWWGVLMAAVLIVAAFAGGFLTGRADRPDHTSEATTAACRTWQVDGTAADLLAARVRTAIEASGFSGSPGQKFVPVVTAARSAATTPGLDDKTFAVFTDLVRRADAAQRAITPNGFGNLDRGTLSAYQDALAAVAVTCHTS